jgi:hypothetical protein
MPHSTSRIHRPVVGPVQARFPRDQYRENQMPFIECATSTAGDIEQSDAVASMQETAYSERITDKEETSMTDRAVIAALLH